MICVALRLQRPKPKNKKQDVSLDDYPLKVRNLLRNSEFRDEITQLEKGKFVFPELDLELTTEPFQQNGKPQEWHNPEMRKKKSIAEKIKDGIRNWYSENRLFPNMHVQQRKQNDLEEQSKEDSEDDGLFSEDDGLFSEGDEWFPEEM